MTRNANTRSAPVVLVEGTCGAGKTTLIKAIEKLAEARGVATAMFSQRETYAPIAPSEDLGILDDELNRRILEGLLHSIRTRATGLGMGGLVLVDTLHITQYVRPGVLSSQSYLTLASQAQQFVSLVVVLLARPSTLRERTVEGRRGTGFARYAAKFASEDDASVEYFLGEQSQILELVRKAPRVCSLELTSESPVEELALSVLSSLRDSSSGNLGGVSWRP